MFNSKPDAMSSNFNQMSDFANQPSVQQVENEMVSQVSEETAASYIKEYYELRKTYDDNYIRFNYRHIYEHMKASGQLPARGHKRKQL